MPFRDPPLLPFDPDTPLVLDCGLWEASDGKQRQVSLSFSPKLLEWAVNTAFLKEFETLVIKLGTPNLTVELLEP